MFNFLLKFKYLFYCFEGIGIFFSIKILLAFDSGLYAWITKIGLTLFCLQYLLIRFCATWHWYPKAHRLEGIELHFRKILFFTSILLLMIPLLTLLKLSIVLWPGNAILIFFNMVNGLLLYIHAKDESDIPINHFTSNRYLERVTK